MSYKKVNKTVARRLYNEGKKIYVIPNKLYCEDDNKWGLKFELSKESNVPYGNELYDFDKWVDNFEYCNCNKEIGKRASFYVKEVIWLDLVWIE